MDEGKARSSAPKPQWWQRRRPRTGEQPEADQWLLPEDAATAPGPEATGGAPVPLHAPDPYGTPPYGRPGPWAPAPPVQRPTVTPPHGTPTPAAVTYPQQGPTPAQGTPMPAEPTYGQQGPTPAQGTPMSTPAHGQPAAPAPTEEQSDFPLPAPAPAADAPAPAEGAGAPAQAPVDAHPHPAAAGTAASAPHTAAHPQPYPGPTPAQGTPVPAAPAYPQPGPTPPQGTAVPPVTPYPQAAQAGLQGHPGPAQPQAAPQGPWQYDPWAASAATAAVPPTGGKVPSKGRILAGAAVVAVVAGAIGGGLGAWLERDGGMGHSVTLPQASADAGDRPAGSIAGIAARALPGVVTIHVSGGGAQGTGTGFVLDNKGHILTNNHVVQPAGSSGSISVTFNGGQTAKATLVGRDGGYDLAVIKVSGVSNLTPLALGNSDSVRVGDSVVAIGAPFDLAGTVTTGIISAKERPITAGGKKQDGSDVSYVDALQTDAPINPGNSGGPLMDSKARVIGVNSAIRSAGESESGGQGGSIGLGFAIPINQAKRVAEELINTGRATHPVIGVSLDNAYTGDGARVNSDGDGNKGVTPGGPADKAGIRPRDVIKKVDGVPVHSGRELIIKIRSHRPGDSMALTVERDGKEQDVRLTLGSASAR
ncbi:S1C family serine protease [Streptomyces griseocarneus]|uniref:S1C family serine protease n=1 Tax=Streptomyces griseocarneus TaxID=51201 RepID=UPI00167DC3A8|nr:trypsin-like peptidase domain-containing protein [Streptomyces griseocarneus]MBZ6473304.1 trypsin-like peptidase domain-containing protein [Streptomyces griseocarneus]GHG57686.1 protease [Streptomyces griseocarneus]